MKKLLLILTILSLASCITMDSYIGSSYKRIYKDVMPSVVEILAIGVDEEDRNNWFDSFNDREESGDPLKKLNGIGSGFIIRSIDNKYFIATNNHVVGDLDIVEVILSDGESLIGQVIGRDKRFDLAVVEITTDKKLQVVSYSTSKTFSEGEFVAVLGSPMGYSRSISMGIISHYGRYGGPENNISNYIQTDAAINQGNSGGPMVNMKGEVIGMNTWILAPTGGSIGLGFAVPYINIHNTIDSIIHDNKIDTPWLGIVTNDSPQSRGAFIYHIVKDSPAYNNLEPGDVVIEFNGSSISKYQDLILNISLISSGDIAKFKILRNGEKLTLEIKLDSHNNNPLNITKDLFPGFIVGENEGDFYVLNVIAKSVGQQVGLKEGDKILSFNGKAFKTTDDFYNYINKGINKIVISRDEEEFELELNY